MKARFADLSLLVHKLKLEAFAKFYTQSLRPTPPASTGPVFSPKIPAATKAIATTGT
jgi:hypothetical protein